MQLTEHRYEQQMFVHQADAIRVVVVDREFRHSVLLSTQDAVEFSAHSVSELDARAIEQVLALQPEVVLLGTGMRATFPAPAVLARFLQLGIGLETMDNAAAARTFNVLAGEGRKVVAVFLLPA